MCELSDDAGHVCDGPSDDEIAEWEEQTREQKDRIFRIYHQFDIGNQDVYVERHEGSVDGRQYTASSNAKRGLGLTQYYQILQSAHCCACSMAFATGQ